MINKNYLKIIAALSLMTFCGMNVHSQVSAGGAIMAVDERVLDGGGKAETNRPVSSSSARVSSKAKKNSVGKKTPSAKTNQVASAKTNQTTYKKAAPKPQPSKKYDGFTIGGDDFFFNFEIVQAVQPIHTIKAQEAGAKGLVQVEVLIDVDGSVLQARARSGNKLLHAEAEKAALMTKFKKFSVYGKPARAFGFIVFRFGARED